MTKSELIAKIAYKYPTLYLSDIEKIVFTIINTVSNTISSGNRVELRGFGTFRTNIQKESIRRNPKTGTKIIVPKKRTIKWKMSKDLFKKLNNEKE